MRAALLALVFLGCATTSGAKQPCPSEPVCLTTPRCDFDAARGCSVCICSDAMIDRGAEPPPGQPPFQR